MLDYLKLGDARRASGAGSRSGRSSGSSSPARSSSKPRLLLLDEPAGGLNHEEVEELAALIRAHPRGLRA